MASLKAAKDSITDFVALGHHGLLRKSMSILYHASKSTCSIFRNLILTNGRINAEATELFFANIDIEFALDHNDIKPYRKSALGLHGFDYLWRSGSSKYFSPRQLEDYKLVVLQNLLRNVRSVTLTIRSDQITKTRWYAWG
jgi:hypothetical protein